uniref:Lens fiber membrane intrinsic protein n=1 Tax=Falco tinnunculus TaxID=100819 RepID=A0A8C4TSS3_FALTI
MSPEVPSPAPPTSPRDVPMGVPCIPSCCRLRVPSCPHGCPLHPLVLPPSGPPTLPRHVPMGVPWCCHPQVSPCLPQMSPQLSPVPPGAATPRSPHLPQTYPHDCPLRPPVLPPPGPPPEVAAVPTAPPRHRGMPAGGGLLCGASGLALLLAATATHFWLQRRAPGGTASLGLWRTCLGGHCRPHPSTPALWEATRVLMLLSVLTAAAGLALGLSVVASGARRARARVAGVTLLLAGLLALLGLAVYTAGTLSLLGPTRATWRFSWSYILGWVAVVLTGSAGLFHLCAAAKDPSPESSEAAGA